MSKTRYIDAHVKGGYPLDKRTVQNTVEDALLNIPLDSRYLGLTVFIENVKKEYYWKNSIDDAGFIEKTTEIPPIDPEGFVRKVIRDHYDHATHLEYLLVEFPNDEMMNINIKLPAFPDPNNTIIVQDITYKCSLERTITILGNGHGLGDTDSSSDADDLVLDVAGVKVILTFNEQMGSWDLDFGQVTLVHNSVSEGYLPPSFDMSNYPTRDEVRQMILEAIEEATATEQDIVDAIELLD